jgi:hypothetical protein
MSGCCSDMVAGLICIGLILIATALKNTQHEFGAALQRDVLGTGGFLTWAAAIMAIGAIGYLPEMRTPSRYMLALLGVVIVVRNGGVWANAEAGLQQASQLGPAPSLPAPAVSAGSGSGSGSGSGGSSGGGDSTASTLGTVAEVAAIALL